ncbi:hypothetical protein [Sporosarcina sp. FSL K6-3457]|uniref:hypothetical protein n=1 Tax=Sporosarcina sp. FSL K6-3457 TaxID=2978204 RepID=UPI0030FBA2C3
MHKEYLRDEVLEILVEKEVMLGLRYQVGKLGEYVYFLKIDDVVEIKKVNFSAPRYEVLKRNCWGEMEIDELICSFEINMNYSDNEDRFYDAKDYNFEKLIFDKNGVIIGFI